MAGRERAPPGPFSTGEAGAENHLITDPRTCAGGRIVSGRG
jgi:hypothetical protein